MRQAALQLTRTTMANRPIVIGIALLVAAEALLLILSFFMPIAPLLRGWLVAFAIWSSVPVGSMTLLLIHRLTGGAWGVAAAPVLRPAAAMIPLVALGFIPIVIGLALIYPWAADSSTIPADVARWYLNGTSFAIRALIALAGWSLLGIVFAAGLGSRLLAGLGLAFFGLTISLVAVDWYLSLEPHYVASAFAAMIAIQQLLAALAVACLIGLPTIDGKVAGDLGALLMATLLGVVYLELMTFVVAWYGDLPDKAAWFLKRGTTAWVSVLITALVIGAALPFGMLLKKALRRNSRALRIIGALIVVGIALHVFWLLAPAFDIQIGVLVAACVILAAMAFISLLIGSTLNEALRSIPGPEEIRRGE